MVRGFEATPDFCRPQVQPWIQRVVGASEGLLRRSVLTVEASSEECNASSNRLAINNTLAIHLPL